MEVERALFNHNKSSGKSFDPRQPLSTDALLDRAQSAVEDIDRLLGGCTRGLNQRVGSDLLEDLLAVMPARGTQREYCSL